MGGSAAAPAGERRPAQGVPEGFEAYWRARAEACADLAATAAVDPVPTGIQAETAECLTVGFTAHDGQRLAARVLLPKAPGPRPCILTWHDADRGPRGWFHLARYLAAGCVVVHPEYRPLPRDLFAGWQEGPGAMPAARLVEDALLAAHLAARLPGVDASRLMTHGEGLGALPALAAAALVPGVAKCAVLNAQPAAARIAWEQGVSGPVYGGVTRHFRVDDPCAERADEYFAALGWADAANFAALLPAGTGLLDGVCLMDGVAPPAAQLAAYEGATCAKRLVTYPKYGHERLNDFENRHLSFMHFGERDA
ncbi:MAG: acetylxylan esterase [Coriobacteriia bacterium]|nr:acetylxylan esterase [Coriobacteriia bacterium]